MILGEMLQPSDAGELQEAVCEAVAAATPIEARAGGSKRDIGAPGRHTRLIDVSSFNGVVDYEPSELVLTVRPATPLREVEALLAENGQMLAFEPIDHGPLFGRPAGTATIGGVIASGVAGPRRVSAGGARDHLLGFQAVSGHGECFRAGGKVVKNVTGYDVSKIMAGSWGQLAILTEISIKVVPRPRASRTVALRGASAAHAVMAMARAMGTSCAVSAAAHIPAEPHGHAITAFRLEGFDESVAARTRQLAEVLAEFGSVATMSEDGADSFWRAVSCAEPILSGPTLWRVNLTPSRAASFVEEVERAGGQWLLDWAGAAAWVAAPATFDMHGVAARFHGHAMLIQASPLMVAETPLRHRGTSLSALSARLKAAFDPAGILDPHRFD